MIPKMLAYVLFVLLPAGLITSFVDVEETRNDLALFVETNTPPEEITDGAIMGSIIAPNAEIIIKGIDGVEIVKGTTNEVGEFFIKGFGQGVYDIVVEATFDQKTERHIVKQVAINIGEVTALGTITLE